jgi:AcrR family transcriptional regulator
MAKPKTKSASRHDMVLDQLMEGAERLFARQGVAGTTLQQLAEEVGLTRTGIYHYVRGKDEMLEMLVKGFTLDTAQNLEELAAARDRPAIARLREGLENMARKVAQHPQRFRVLLTSEGAFSEPLAKQYRQARRRTLAALTELVAQAISEGSCRPVDPELAAFSLAGVANWVAFWYPRAESAGALPPDDVAARLADIALGGIVTDRTPPNGEGIAHVIGLLREDLSRLEHMVEDR